MTASTCSSDFNPALLQVQKFSGAVFKGFTSRQQAQDFVDAGTVAQSSHKRVHPAASSVLQSEPARRSSPATTSHSFDHHHGFRLVSSHSRTYVHKRLATNGAFPAGPDQDCRTLPLRDKAACS